MIRRDAVARALAAAFVVEAYSKRTSCGGNKLGPFFDAVIGLMIVGSVTIIEMLKVVVWLPKELG